jgi:hypothetical protein
MRVSIEGSLVHKVIMQAVVVIPGYQHNFIFGEVWITGTVLFVLN